MIPTSRIIPPALAPRSSRLHIFPAAAPLAASAAPLAASAAPLAASAAPLAASAASPATASAASPATASATSPATGTDRTQRPLPCGAQIAQIFPSPYLPECSAPCCIRSVPRDSIHSVPRDSIRIISRDRDTSDTAPPVMRSRRQSNNTPRHAPPASPGRDSDTNTAGIYSLRTALNNGPGRSRAG
jgi:hypothetical protein